MSSVIRIEGPNSSNGRQTYGTLPFQQQHQQHNQNAFQQQPQQQQYGTLPFQQHQHNQNAFQQQPQQHHSFQQQQQPQHVQQQHSGMQFYSTLPSKPERRVQFADGSKPGPPDYSSVYAMRSAPTNLSRPLPTQTIQLGQAMPIKSGPAPMNSGPAPMNNGPAPMNNGPAAPIPEPIYGGQPRQSAYAMPINASSTLNIQLMLQQGLQGIRLQGPSVGSTSSASSTTSSNSGIPSFQLQRQASESSSSGSTVSNQISTEAEVYAQIDNFRGPSTATSATSTTEVEVMTPPPPPPPPPPQAEPIYASTSCSTQTQTQTEAPEESDIRPHSPPPPLVPTRQFLPPEFGSDSGKGSMPEGGDDLRSLQSGSSGGERSDLSLDFMPNGTEASTFEFQDHNNIGPVSKQKPCRVGMVVTPGAALMVKMTIAGEEFCDDPAALELLADITEVCWKEIREQAKHEMINLTGPQLGKLKVRNNRPCSEDVKELSEKLGVEVELSEGMFRRYDDSSNCHVANYMYEIVKTRGGCTVGKTGVVICVRKRNKYAPVDAFCEQLCEHIATHKPRWVGKVDLAKVKKNNHHQKTLLELGRKGFLLPQTFQFDPTINVAEAAKRSFVELLDFVHFYY